MFLHILLPTLLHIFISSASAAHLRQVVDPSLSQLGPDRTRFDDDKNGPCDESFPIHDSIITNQKQQHQWLMVAIPDDKSGRSYAPLCDDGRHIDVRRLTRCNGGACFSQAVQQCTFECTWNQPSIQLTASPTLRPTQPQSRVITTNHALLELCKLTSDYRPSSGVRQAIVEYLTELIRQNLGHSLEVTSAKWAGHLPGDKARCYSLPLEVQASGPEDMSKFALPYILQTIRENDVDLVSYLETLEGGIPFEYVQIESVDTYDPSDVVEGPTDPPSLTPIEALELVLEEVRTPSVVMMEDEPSGGIPVWVWLLLFLLALLICAIGTWICFVLKGTKEEKDEKEEKDVEMYSARHRDDDRAISDQKRYDAASRRASQQRRRTESSRVTKSRTLVNSQQSYRATSSRVTKARLLVNRSFTRNRLPEEQQRSNHRQREVEEPTMEVISALPTGEDPPEEMETRLVLHSPSHQEQQTSHAARQAPRDPTRYIPDGDSGDKEEPDGLKIDRKESMIVTDADRYRDIDVENGNSGKDPDANVGAYEMNRKHHSSRKKSRRKSQRAVGSRSGMERLKRSLNWERNETAAMTVYVDNEELDKSSYDSPSIMTQPQREHEFQTAESADL